MQYTAKSRRMNYFFGIKRKEFLMVFNTLKLLFSVLFVLSLSACTSDSRYHEIQSARLNECNYMADKEYHECVKRQESGYDEYKNNRANEQASKNDKN